MRTPAFPRMTWEPSIPPNARGLNTPRQSPAPARSLRPFGGANGPAEKSRKHTLRASVINSESPIATRADLLTEL